MSNGEEGYRRRKRNKTVSYYLREPPGGSTYRILPPRASRKLNLSHTTSASLPGRKSRSRQILAEAAHEIFHWKNWAFFATFLSHVFLMNYGFYRWGCAGGGSEEDSRTSDRALSTEEVRTPKAKPNWGMTTILYRKTHRGTFLRGFSQGFPNFSLFFAFVILFSYVC